MKIKNIFLLLMVLLVNGGHVFSAAGAGEGALLDAKIKELAAIEYKKAIREYKEPVPTEEQESHLRYVFGELERESTCFCFPLPIFQKPFLHRVLLQVNKKYEFDEVASIKTKMNYVLLMLFDAALCDLKIKKISEIVKLLTDEKFFEDGKLEDLEGFVTELFVLFPWMKEGIVTITSGEETKKGPYGDLARDYLKGKTRQQLFRDPSFLNVLLIFDYYKTCKLFGVAWDSEKVSNDLKSYSVAVSLALWAYYVARIVKSSERWELLSESPNDKPLMTVW